MIRLPRVAITTKPKCILAVMVTVGSLAGSASADNMILNGSFEENTAGRTRYNLDNSVVTDLMNNVTAFGERRGPGDLGEIDIMTWGGGFGIEPLDGDWHVGLAVNGSNGPSDAFSFDLSSSITAGTSYDLSFWVRPNGVFGSGKEPLEIGVSSDPNSFGALLYTSAPLSFGVWTEYVTSVEAPVGGDYLTVRIYEGFGRPNTWAHIDDFQFSIIPEPGTLVMFVCFSLFGLGRRLPRRT